MICMQKLVRVDGKIRTDATFPAGFMDVVEIPKSGDQFRLLYDCKGRFVLHRVDSSEKAYKLCRVNRNELTKKSVPYLATNDGRTIRYPDPLIEVHDTVKVDIETGKIVDFVKFEVGNLCMVTKGSNTGRVGVITKIERHPGSFDIVAIRDAAGHSFATRRGNVFIIGKGNESWVTLPKGRGVSLSILEEREMIMKKRKH